MSVFNVDWNGSSEDWANLFLNSEEIRAGLMQYGAAAAANNTSRLQSSKGAKPEHAFVARIEKLDKTMVCKVIANGSGAKKVAVSANLPTW